MSVRNPHSRSRSVRRSIRTQRSADTISDSLNSYSISDPDRYFADSTMFDPLMSLKYTLTFRFYEDGIADGVGGLQRNRPSKRSLPRSLNQVQIQQPAEQDQQQWSPKSISNDQYQDPALPLNPSSLSSGYQTYVYFIITLLFSRP